MANSVENRAVEMTFKNDTFSQRIAETIASLEKLNNTIGGLSDKDGLRELSNSAKGFNMNPMANAIEGVSKKFLALSTIGITVLSNIVNRAVDAGISLAKSLSLDQVISGFQEYELNMKSIQTILANTKADGTNLGQVNDALDELNSYADKTIYNFAEMARNIGTFTAAGVDLDTSVLSIKGIANAAAISGSTSQQASTAMYQLSQAIASGSLKLMDWNSVVNAGMGGEVMQRALFTTGKAMGTLVDVPIDQTFDDWKDSGNSFRESLQEGWITTDVLTTTLKGFSGEATAAELAAAGFTETMIADFQELGETGIESATKVRTLTQLIDTAKEAVGSGWSQSFRILFGDFEEATELFTGISQTLDGMISKSADSRNSLLQGWKDLGGRDDLLAGLKDSFTVLGRILDSVKFAFQTVFPPVTAERLAQLTSGFAEFAATLNEKIGPYLGTIQVVFEALFSVVSVLGTAVKETGRFFGELFSYFTQGADRNATLNFIAGIADAVINLKTILVDDGGIRKFFDTLLAVIKDPSDAIQFLRDKFEEFVDRIKSVTLGDIDVFEALPDVFGRLEDRFDGIKTAAGKLSDIWEPVKEAFGKIYDVLDEAWTAITDWFKDLGGDMADAAEEGDFDAVVDVINVGLLGGIGVILTKFLKNGLNLDFGGGVLDNLSGTFKELTGVLQAMQTDIKANALLKIAGAIGILTASVLVLSLIDSAALTKSLTAMAVGFGQLLGAFAIITKLSVGPSGAASFAVISGGMIALSLAILALSGAVALLSTLDWDELAKGLLGVLALLGMVVATSKLLGGSGAQMILAGVGMIGIAVALNILAGAMKIFATMSWEDMAKGLVGVAGGLVGIGLAMKLMPPTMPLIGAGLVLVSTSLAILAGAMKIFATMSWGEMAKGIVAVGGGLLVIGLAMNLFPPTMPLIGAGLLLVSISLIAIAQAMGMIADLSWTEIGKGLLGIAGALVALGLGAALMSGSIGGALAITVMAGALYLLVGVIKEFAKIKFGDLLKGLGGIALALGVLAGAALLLSPAIGPLVALGAALVLIGGGFALFGVGVSLVAKGFEILAKAGKAGAEALGAALKAIGAALPALLTGLAEGLVEFLNVLLAAAPVFVEQIGVILAQVLETIIELIPQAVEAMVVFVTEMLAGLREVFPDVVEAGFEMLLELLGGIRDNMGEIVTVVAEIITEFLEALADHVEDIIAAGAEVVANIITGIGQSMEDIVTAGADAVISFVQGIADNVLKVVDAGFDIVIDFINGLADSIREHKPELADAGWNLIDAIFSGITDMAEEVKDWFVALPGNIWEWIGDTFGTLIERGVDLVAGFLNGIYEKAVELFNWVRNLPDYILTAIGDVWSWLTDKGTDLIAGFLHAIVIKAVELATWVAGLGDRVIGWVGDALSWLYEKGKDVIRGLWDGIESMYDWFAEKIEGVAGWVTNPLAKIWEMFSPSRVMAEMGVHLIEGLANGILSTKKKAESAASELGATVLSGFNGLEDSLREAVESLGELEEFNPTITPVLDLTQVQAESSKIGDILAANAASQSVAISELNTRDTDEGDDDDLGPRGPGGDVIFNQTINAPRELSTADMYRQSRNLVTLAKEELKVP